jgi:hypothetical protein
MVDGERGIFFDFDAVQNADVPNTSLDDRTAAIAVSETFIDQLLGSVSGNSSSLNPGGIDVPYVGDLQDGRSVNTTVFANQIARFGSAWSGVPNHYDIATTLTGLNYNFGIGDGQPLFRGVAPECRWAGFRVLNDSGEGVEQWIIDALAEMIDGRVNNHIKVANLSVGGPVSEQLRAAVNDAVRHGVFVAVAAGRQAKVRRHDFDVCASARSR